MKARWALLFSLVCAIKFAAAASSTQTDFSDTEINRILSESELSRRVAVDANCARFSLANTLENRSGGAIRSKPNRVIRLDAPRLEQEAREVLKTGLKCLRSLSPLSAGIANEVVQNALGFEEARAGTAKKPLTLSCQVPTRLQTSSSGITAAVAATFEEPAFPAVYLNSAGLDPYVYRQTIFHEFLHLSGSLGHQRFHRYDDSRQLELVEPCAECCMDGDQPSSIKTISCDLCSGKYKDNPALHALIYADTQLKQSYPQIAAAELQKSVAADPSNAQAWLELASSMNLLSRGEEMNFKILAALDQAIAVSKAAEAQDKIRRSDFYQSIQARVFRSDDTQWGRYSSRRVLSESEKKLIIRYEKALAIFKLTSQACGPMVAPLDPAAPVGCRARALGYLSEISRAAQEIQAADANDHAAFNRLFLPGFVGGLNPSGMRRQRTIDCMATVERTFAQCFELPHES